MAQPRTEGHKGRTKILYHVTSTTAAQSIESSQQMNKGKSGMFGAGIYFAESPAICKTKAHFHGATIQATVELGKSLICYQPCPKMDYSTLTTKYSCDSVKGVGCVSNPEYCVYQSIQVKNIKIINGKQYAQSLCMNNKCKYYLSAHKGNCVLFCEHNNCQHYHKYHAGNCIFLCQHKNCKNYHKYHAGNCIFLCQHRNCKNYHTYHGGNCIF